MAKMTLKDHKQIGSLKLAAHGQRPAPHSVLETQMSGQTDPADRSLSSPFPTEMQLS